MPKDTTTDELLAKIDELNDNPDVHGGILLQHPVPTQIDERACLIASVWIKMSMASPARALGVCQWVNLLMAHAHHKVSCIC